MQHSCTGTTSGNHVTFFSTHKQHRKCPLRQPYMHTSVDPLLSLTVAMCRFVQSSCMSVTLPKTQASVYIVTDMHPTMNLDLCTSLSPSNCHLIPAFSPCLCVCLSENILYVETVWGGGGVFTTLCSQFETALKSRAQISLGK